MNKIGKLYGSKMRVAAILALVAGTAAHAADIGDALTIHGYGHQGYLQGNANNYLGADPHGSWDYNLMALTLTAAVDDSTKIWLQLRSTALQTRLEWAFVNYQFSPYLSGRAGEIKFPFGLYNEYIDAHFLLLSTLPPLLYQDSGMRYTNMRGLAANFKHAAGNGDMAWDIYAGQVQNPNEVGISKYGRMLGGRLIYKTPVDGLRFMASAFGSNEEEIATGNATRQKTSALSIDYTADNWDVKAETAHNAEFGVSSSTSYVQAGYKLGESWLPFMRYDYITTDQARKSDPSYYQKTTTVGLNYSINANVSVRLEDQINRGYAMPVKTYVAPGGPEVATGVAAGAGSKNWNLLAASINFIF